MHLSVRVLLKGLPRLPLPSVGRFFLVIGSFPSPVVVVFAPFTSCFPPTFFFFFFFHLKTIEQFFVLTLNPAFQLCSTTTFSHLLDGWNMSGLEKTGINGG